MVFTQHVYGSLAFKNIGQCGRLSQLSWLLVHFNIVYLLTYLLTYHVTLLEYDAQFPIN